MFFICLSIVCTSKNFVGVNGSLGYIINGVLQQSEGEISVESKDRLISFICSLAEKRVIDEKYSIWKNS